MGIVLTELDFKEASDDMLDRKIEKYAWTLPFMDVSAHRTLISTCFERQVAKFIREAVEGQSGKVE